MTKMLDHLAFQHEPALVIFDSGHGAGAVRAVVCNTTGKRMAAFPSPSRARRALVAAGYFMTPKGFWVLNASQAQERPRASYPEGEEVGEKSSAG